MTICSESSSEVKPNIDATAFFETAVSAYKQAEQVADEIVEYYFRIGGRIICLRFAGRSLVTPLTQAFSHLAAVCDQEPDLTIHLWDSASTGVTPPHLPALDNAYNSTVQTRYFVGDGVKLALSPTAGTLCSYDPATRLGLYWAQAAESIPPWEIASPLRAILGWWTLDNDDLLVHGAAVGWAQNGLLLTAQGGSGKSTTALACLQAGLSYAGDDYVLLSGQAPDIYSVYNTAKLYPQHLSKTLPELAKFVFSEVNPDYDKVVLDLQHTTQLAERMTLRAILVPHISATGQTALQQTSGIQVLKGLAPSTLFQLPGANAKVLDKLGQLVKQVPGYTLALGTDLAEVVNMIRQLLTQLAEHER